METIRVTPPENWVEFSRRDLSKQAEKINTLQLKIDNIEYLLQRRGCKTVPELPYIIVFNEKINNEKSSNLRKELMNYPKVTIPNNSNWLLFLKTLDSGKILYDYSNNRFFIYSIKTVGKNEQILFLKVIYLLKTTTVNIHFIVKENEFTRYSAIFNNVLLSAKHELVRDRFSQLISERNILKEITDVSYQSVKWSDMIGLFGWVIIVSFLILVFLRDHKHPDLFTA